MNLIKLTTILQLALVLMLAQIPSTIQGEGVSRDGVRLVMKTQSGDIVRLRAARGALEEAAVTPAGGESHRGRKNRKMNKSEDQQQAGGHKAGSKKSQIGAENAAGQNAQGKHKAGHKNSEKQHRQGDKQQQHGHHRANKRTGAQESRNSASTCRYAKSAWSECDNKTNMRTRVLSLKKGEQNCLPTRTIQKKCKKGCRYEKGAWSPCNNGQMTREDKLQTEANGGSDQSCDSVRTVNKKCRPNGSGNGAGAGNGSGAGAGKHNNGSNRSPKERKQKEKGGLWPLARNFQY
ncbi:hypothetical protein KR018_008579 [Drosophila ironensis]|nr:hypothetical protein KR018_008579 [Drosophila ironensis]